MDKESYHYSIAAAEEELREAFPELDDGGAASLTAMLDMGDKQLEGTLYGCLKGDFVDGRPAFLFYPDASVGSTDNGVLNPSSPTQLFRTAQPGGEGQNRGLYYLAEKGVYFLGDADENTVSGWEFACFLYSLSVTGELPEAVYAPIYDVTLPEDASYGSYLELLYRAGILPWEEPNWVFDTDAPITRAQFAVTLHRLLEPEAR